MQIPSPIRMRITLPMPVFTDPKLVVVCAARHIRVDFAVLAFWMPHSALFAMTIVFAHFLWSMVRSTWLQRCGKCGKAALGLAVVQRHRRHTHRCRVVVAPLAATLALAYFLWVSGHSGQFSPVCWRYPPPFVCAGNQGRDLACPQRAAFRAPRWIILWMFFTRPIESFLAAGWDWVSMLRSSV